jgi:hypothetical protein
MAALAAGPVAAAEGEQLRLDPIQGPPPWKEVTHQRDGARFLIEIIPSDQDINAYREILSAQSFPALKGQDPAEYLKGMFTRLGGSCDGARVNGPKAGLEQGAPVAYAQIYCGRQRGRDFGVQMFFKVLQGTDALYVVLREMRVPPSAQGGMMSFSKDEMPKVLAIMKAASEANQYLVEHVGLCGGATSPKCEHGA